MDIHNVAMNIRSERVRIGLTVDGLAKAVGVSKNTIASWELNKRSPDGSYLMRMANIFGCTTDYLLGLTDERT